MHCRFFPFYLQTGIKEPYVRNVNSSSAFASVQYIALPSVVNNSPQHDYDEISDDSASNEEMVGNKSSLTNSTTADHSYNGTPQIPNEDIRQDQPTIVSTEM